MNDSSVHIPVMPSEVLELGHPQAGQVWIDGTAGGGGHSRLIAERVGEAGRLLAIDRDPQVIARLAGQLSANVTLCQGSYDNASEELARLGLIKAHGILLDLGLSSDQLSDRERGFSFQSDGPLDMRFDTSCGEPAWEWLERVDEKTLADTIYRYGEERFSRRIAHRIVETRRTQPVRTANELRELIYRSVPRTHNSRSQQAKRSFHPKGRSKPIDPATRTFQALRIAVNDELAILERALQRLPDILADGGALLIISFHSLEDRLVKYAFRGDERLEIVTRRPVQASESEIASNPRSRSAKLRVARKRGIELP